MKTGNGKILQVEIITCSVAVTYLTHEIDHALARAVRILTVIY
jgi:hypothetical protein